MLTLFLILCCSIAVAQEGNSKPETFEMEWEGQRVTMQKYLIIFLKKGPNRDQSKEEAEKIQA